MGDDTVCAECGDAIVGQANVALGRTYHPEHFVCAFDGCSASLQGMFFPGSDNKPYCERHHFELSGLLCVSCRHPVRNTSVSLKGAIDVKKTLYHPTCFQCKECGKNLLGRKHVAYQDDPWCNVCIKQVFGDVDNSDEDN